MSIETSVEELFPARPGGLVDSARKNAAAAAAQAPAGDEPEYNGTSYDPVRVELRVPETAASGTVVIAAGTATPLTRLLGEDGQRFKGVIWTLDQPVVVTFSRALAEDPRNATNVAGQSAGGAVLPVGMVLPVDTTSEIWVTATSSTATRVAFINQTFAAR